MLIKSFRSGCGQWVHVPWRHVQQLLIYTGTKLGALIYSPRLLDPLRTLLCIPYGKGSRWRGSGHPRMARTALTCQDYSLRSQVGVKSQVPVPLIYPRRPRFASCEGTGVINVGDTIAVSVVTMCPCTIYGENITRTGSARSPCPETPDWPWKSRLRKPQETPLVLHKFVTGRIRACFARNLREGLSLEFRGLQKRSHPLTTSSGSSVAIGSRPSPKI